MTLPNIDLSMAIWVSKVLFWWVDFIPVLKFKKEIILIVKWLNFILLIFYYITYKVKNEAQSVGLNDIFLGWETYFLVIWTPHNKKSSRWNHILRKCQKYYSLLPQYLGVENYLDTLRVKKPPGLFTLYFILQIPTF